MGPDVTWYIVLSAFLFTIGSMGVLLRRSPLIVLLSLEIMLNSANLTLIGFARHVGHTDGQVFEAERCAYSILPGAATFLGVRESASAPSD